MLRIGIVAGEASGDLLGAGLIEALSKTISDFTLEGIGGDKLVKTGMNILYPMERLSVMGIIEVLGRYKELKKIQLDIRDYFITNPPDVFIGIDAPDFNLWLEKELRKAGITTVHYVSPSVWAWREYRVKKIKKAVDLILTLFPFESAIYDKYGIPNQYVGHPLADKLADEPDKSAARNELDLPIDKTIVALLPGSRSSEIKTITGPLLQAAEITKRSDQELHFISGFVNEESLNQFKVIKNKLVPNMIVDMYIAKTHRVMEAADVIMLASGTATLEAMLLKKPMVVAYRLSWVTYIIVKMLANIPYASLPNILAGKKIIPECLQADCTPEILSSELQKILSSGDEILKLESRFSELSQQLRRNANEQAAKAILELLEKRKYV